MAFFLCFLGFCFSAHLVFFVLPPVLWFLHFGLSFSFFFSAPSLFFGRSQFFFFSPVGYDSLSFYKAKIGGNGRPPKCPVTDPLSAFNAEI
jgi:hypothetical protein